MVRKQGKLPNSVSGAEYYKEYKGVSASGGDTLCVPRDIIPRGARVLVIDDLMATGGTMIAACDLLTHIGAVIVDCAVMVELKALGGCAKLQEKYPTVNVSHILSLLL